jgi:hypothetical protein
MGCPLRGKIAMFLFMAALLVSPAATPSLASAGESASQSMMAGAAGVTWDYYLCVAAGC